MHPDTGISNKAMAILNRCVLFVNKYVAVGSLIRHIIARAASSLISSSVSRPRLPSLPHTPRSLPSLLVKSKPLSASSSLVNSRSTLSLREPNLSPRFVLLLRLHDRNMYSTVLVCLVFERRCQVDWLWLVLLVGGSCVVVACDVDSSVSPIFFRSVYSLGFYSFPVAFHMYSPLYCTRMRSISSLYLLVFGTHQPLLISQHLRGDPCSLHKSVNSDIESSGQNVFEEI